MTEVRRMFAGSNSGLGFHSFFDYVLGKRAHQVFLLKGGPGTGKSRLMKAVAEAFAGEEQEQFFCSSDSHSLDAVALLRPGIVLMDATAPHSREAELPGCRDHLVDLGAFWSAEGLLREREAIGAKTTFKRFFFQSAFHYLEAARLIEEKIAGENCIGPGVENTFPGKIVEILSPLSGKEQGTQGTVRHLFASAITPEGYVSHVRELVKPLGRIYLVSGPPGTGKSRFLGKLAEQAAFAGQDLEVFHYPLDPRQVLHVFIPGLDTAVLTATFWDSLEDVAAERLAFGGKAELSGGKDRKLVQELFDEAVHSLQQAQKVHLELEQLYAAQMDFIALSRYTKKLIGKIKTYSSLS